MLLDETENNTGINPNRAHFRAGSGQFSSGASFAREFRHWWQLQKRFGRQADLADFLDIGPSTLQFWFASRAFPSDPLCEKLYALTNLDCFSPVGRNVARAEHEEKRGLSRPAIAKRAKHKYLTEAEREECLSDPDRVFTIRGDKWIACLECGRLLRQIHGEEPAGHLLQHGITDEEYREGRYGPNIGLICRELRKQQAVRSSAVYEERLRRFAGTSVPPSRKGCKNPPEFSRHQSARMRGTRSPNLAKDVTDVEFAWPWLMDGKDIRKVGEAVNFTIGGAWARLKAIIGTPIRKTFQVEPEFGQIERAVRIIQPITDDPALRTEVAKLCEESRKEVVAGKRDSRVVLLLLPIVRSWMSGKSGRATDLALRFLEERAWVSRRPRKKKRGVGRPRSREPMVEQAEKLRAENPKLSWSQLAQKVDPEGFATNQDAAADSIRLAITYRQGKK